MKTAAMLLAALAISGCGGGNGAANESLKAELAEVKAALGEMRKRQNDLEMEQIKQVIAGPQDSALFDPQEDSGYTAVKAPAGPVLVVLQKVEPYLDGYTVTFRLGNPTAADYAGVTGTVRWGRKFDPKNPGESTELQEKEIDLKDNLPSGQWTMVKFNVAPAKAEEMRRIVFAPKFNEVRLRRTYPN